MSHNHDFAARPNVNPRALPILALAGRAVLTFRNDDAGTHMTVKITQKRDKHQRGEDGKLVKLPVYRVFISLLGDGVQRMVFAGMFFTDQPTIRIWVDRKLDQNGRHARALRWVAAAIANPEILRGKLDEHGRRKNRVGLFHENRCCCCSMPLTHPESIHTGMGPVCLRRKAEQMSRENVDILQLFEPVSE